MLPNFESCLAFVLAEEGGFVDHPDDPGGATNMGITQSVYDAARISGGLPPRSVRAIDPAETRAIYRHRYWAAVRGDDLPAGVDLVIFDAAVNSGASQAGKWLQRAINANSLVRGRWAVVVDGAIGPKTVAAARQCDVRDLIENVCAQRLSMLKGLKTWPVFGRGWSGRVERVQRAAQGMIA